MATQWGRIKAAWLKGGVTYAELAKKYHVSAKTIQNRASKEGWKKEKVAIQEEVGKATHARIVRAKVEELEMLIEANRSMAEALKKLTDQILDDPEILKGGKNDGKMAASITQAIETTARVQRDLHKLPTLDQDQAAKEFRMNKKIQTAKMQLEREKWDAEKKRREQELHGDGGVVWVTEDPEGEDLDG